MWKLREIVLGAILAVVFGVIYMGWDWLNSLLPTTLSPIVLGLFNGVWWMAAGLVAYIVRRPGAAFFAEVVSAFFEFAFGSPYGAGAMISGLLQGAGAEAGFALGRWRRYSVGMMVLSAALGGVGNTLQWYFQYGGNQYRVGIIVGYLLTTMLSGAVFAGLLPKLIGDALNRAGVLRNFELGRQTRASSN